MVAPKTIGGPPASAAWPSGNSGPLHAASRRQSSAGSSAVIPVRRLIKSLPLRHKAIPHARLRLQIARVRRLALQLAPQPAHVDAQIFGLVMVLAAPDALQQQAVRKHLVR